MRINVVPGLGGNARLTWTIGVMAAVVLAGGVSYAWLTRPTGTLSAAHVAGGPSRPSGRSTGAGTATGLTISVRIDASGAAAVTERLAWPPAPHGRSVMVGLPDQVSGAGLPDGQTARPRVSELRVSYGGSAITPDARGGQQWTLELPASASGSALDVTYRLDGVALTSKPAPRGRAIVLIVSMLRALAANAPITVSVAGPTATTILGLNCPSAPAAAMVCGQPSGGQWAATFPAGHGLDARVLTAQVNLPT
ncbi:MAG: hypothetical protein ABI301_07630 [Jatrophihabitantaceae bacterium]